MIRPIPHAPFEYSLQWASHVVDQLVAKYPRATELVCQVYRLDTYSLVKYLAKPDPEWNYLKARIKYLATYMWETRQEPSYLTLVEWLGEPGATTRTLNRLTGLDRPQKSANMGERSSGGQGGAGADSSLPFSPQELASSKPRVAPRERYLVNRRHR